MEIVHCEVTEMALVTVVIPAYNAEKTIEKCLDSIVGQSHKELEIIVVNDGSKDATQNICEIYAKRDSRIKILEQENKGASAARNLGIRYTTGKFLAFVDADDDVEPSMISTLHQIYMEDSRIDLVVCNYDEVIKGNRISADLKCEKIMSQVQFLRNLFRRDSVKGFLWNKLFRTDIIKTHGICLDETVHVCEDLLFCCQYGLCIRMAGYSDRRLYHYVNMESSVTKSGFSKKSFTAVPAFEKLLKILAALFFFTLSRGLNRLCVIICL